MTIKNKSNLLEKQLIEDEVIELPLITLRDMVVFPHVAVPIMVRRERSIKALENAMRRERTIIFSAQLNTDVVEPTSDQIYKVCTLAKIRELVKQDDGSIRVLVEGLMRVRVTSFVAVKPFIQVLAEPLAEPVRKKTEQVEALTYSVLNQFRRIVNAGVNISFDILLVILNVSDPWLLGDLIAANVEMSLVEKQGILEALTVEEKLNRVSQALGRQIKVLQIASKIQADTGRELDKMQREIFLREQIKSIEKELEVINGKPEDDGLKDKIEAAGMPEAVLEKALKEYRRLQAMPTFSPEQSYVRTYLECLAGLPWNKKDESVIDIAQAEKILNEDHFGLEKTKARILEFLAVQKLAGKNRGSIMCFVGPPGTGKTSIGKSIARALGRKFHRLSLGGVHDEAEIRGHRRTYVGSLPGRIISGLAAVDTRNPVFMLDEIDKVGSDFRGDPSSALLEVLDPEQNISFSDHYLEAPFDLSDVLFIATANTLDTIPPALRDRMEIVEFSGYTEQEKIEIAKNYLLPKTLENSGLKKIKSPPVFNDTAIVEIIRHYTHEAGVRNLEREISSICRKLAKLKITSANLPDFIDPISVEQMLGPRKVSHLIAGEQDEVGLVNGLAWTEAGGEILQIEVTRMPGKGNLILTGQLGGVMQESARAAFSYVRSFMRQVGTDNFNLETDVHIHVPSGAIPKDGPSAGVAMTVALISLLTNHSVDHLVGMTGEITLRGRVLEIGGVKEKCLAALRAGLKRIILPYENRKDLIDLSEDVRASMEFVFVKNIDQVLPLVLKE